MKKIQSSILFSLIFSFSLLIHCFGSVDKRGSVRSYENGLVKTVGGHFRIGELSSSWKQQKIDYRAILFQNQNDQSTITVSSWCKRAFDDGTSQALSEQLYAGMANTKILASESIPLDGRPAYLSEIEGEVDGLPVHLKAYTLKMNECVFDFFYVSTPERLESVSDFDQMVQGFHYIKGPKIL